MKARANTLIYSVSRETLRGNIGGKSLLYMGVPSGGARGSKMKGRPEHTFASYSPHKPRIASEKQLNEASDLGRGKRGGILPPGRYEMKVRRKCSHFNNSLAIYLRPVAGVASAYPERQFDE